MGLIKNLFGKSKEEPKEVELREPILPEQLLQNVLPTYIPNLMVGGNTAGITNYGSDGSSVGLTGLNSLKNIYKSSRDQLYNLLPTLGQMTANDLASSNALASNLYKQGANELQGQLSNDIQKFKEDSFRRGLAASSSFLNGINNLYGSNASALANLYGDSQMQGLKYAWDLVDRRSDTANYLTGLNKDLYNQLNEFPLKIGMNYVIPQAEFFDTNKALNLDRLNDYYGIANQGITDYNNALTKNYNTKASMYNNWADNQSNYLRDVYKTSGNTLGNIFSTLYRNRNSAGNYNISGTVV